MSIEIPSPRPPARAARRSVSRTAVAAFAPLALVGLAACGGESTGEGEAGAAPTSPASSTAPDMPADATAGEQPIELLPPGTHVGASWFAPPDPAAQDLIVERWNESNEAATIARVMIDWVDVEPNEGEYDFTELDDQLAEISSRGDLPMVTIVAVDVSGTPFPEWLGGFEPDRAAAAYSAMLEAAAPMLDEHGVWLLAVANEPPLDDGLDAAELARFVAAVESSANDIIPDTAITMVMSNGDALERDPGTRALAQAGDVFGVNHYCLQPDFMVMDPEQALDHLADTIELAGDKPVVFQEFGCPASPELGSSVEYQAAWFEAAFEAIRADDQMVAAFVFDFVDWSPELVALDYEEAFAAEPGLEWVYERLAAWLETSGLVRQDGTTRPAWDVYLANLGG